MNNIPSLDISLLLFLARQNRQAALSWLPQEVMGSPNDV